MNRKLVDAAGRRQFIKSASVFALAAAAWPPTLACVQDRSAASPTNEQRPNRIQIADLKEPGQRILIRGTIYDTNDKPLPNVKIFLYHTDAAGYYSRPLSNPRQARLRGTLWSDAQGRYAFDTIKPAYYANVPQQPAMHIHVHLEPQGLPDHWVDSYYFEGDPQLQPGDMERSKELGRFTNIVRLVPSETGVLEGDRDFRVDPAVAERNKLVDGWYRN